MSFVITGGFGASGGVGAFFVSSVLATTPNSVTVVFDDDPVLLTAALNPSNWTIATFSGLAVNVTAVNVNLSIHAVVLTTTSQLTGGSYALSFPTEIYGFTTGDPLLVPLTRTFTGLGVVPTLLLARAIDTRTTEVIFSVPMMAADALDPSKYNITGGAHLVATTGVTQISAQIFRLTTTEQDPATLYTVTATGVRDLNGNST